MKLNVMDYVLQQHQSRANHPALILVDAIGQQQTIHYKKLYEDVCSLMHGLNALGLAKHSIVCIQAAQVTPKVYCMHNMRFWHEK